MTDSYVLSSAAEGDLRGIVRYTRQRWGEVQTRAYLTKMKGCIERLAGGLGLFKDLAALSPGVRMALCEHHYVFCLSRGEMPSLVVAIFHERMDLMTRLADRLR